MINYFKDGFTGTPVNLSIARMILSAAMIWKIIHYDWVALTTWPMPIVDFIPVLRHEFLLNQIQLIAFFCGLALIAVFVGYRIRVSAFLSAILLTYLGIVRHAHQVSHTSRILFNAALILVMFAVFADEDKMSVDQIRRSGEMSLDALSDHLETGGDQVRNRAMKWSLIVIGFFYFQAGLAKILYSDTIAWIHPSNLGRYILFRSGEGPTWFLADILLQYPILLSVGAVVTIVLEVGFLPAIISGRRIWPFFVGLLGMHASIAFSVGPIFTDQIVFLTLFLPWGRPLKQLQKTEQLVVVYDRHCLLWAKILYSLKYIDLNGSLVYYNQDTVPERFRREDIDLEDSMYVFRGKNSYGGYRAFREISRQLGVLAPAAWVICLLPMAEIGERRQQYVSDN